MRKEQEGYGSKKLLSISQGDKVRAEIFSLACEPEFSPQVAAVKINGILGYVQCSCDFLARSAAADELRHMNLPGRERLGDGTEGR